MNIVVEVLLWMGLWTLWCFLLFLIEFVVFGEHLFDDDFVEGQHSHYVESVRLKYSLNTSGDSKIGEPYADEYRNLLTNTDTRLLIDCILSKYNKDKRQD